MTIQTLNAVKEYAQNVLAGHILAGYAVRKACQRHLDDLEHGHKRDLHFDEAAAAKAIKFFSFLRLAEGEYAGKPFILQPWQQFIVGSLFGWKGSDSHRRFRNAYMEIGKGNGKSPMAAAIGLYGLVADGEAGAEVYAAAVTRDQAKIAFGDAVRMVQSSPDLSKVVKVWTHALTIEQTGSTFRPVSSEARALDGKRVHMAIIDEIHEHPTDLVVNKMRAGTKGRRQSLIVEITNSGYDRHSVCYQHHEYSLKILDGVIENDSWFAYVCQLDPCDSCRREGRTAPSDTCEQCDDWRNEAVWVKGNPNLDVSITRKYLREQVQEAIGMPSKQNIVKRLNFCIWTEQSNRWIDMDMWDKGSEPFDPETLQGRICYAGLDLARIHDLSALVLLFPPVEEGEKWKCLARFWCPEDDIYQRVQRDRVPYDVWAREGLIDLTPGNATDFDFLQTAILELSSQYEIAEIAYDRTFAGELVTHLMAEGLIMVPFGQGFLSMMTPTAELSRMLRAEQLQHGGHPILRWNASNMTVAQDPAGNEKPDKAKSTERIDGIVALIMAIGRATVHQGEGEIEAHVFFV